MAFYNTTNESGNQLDLFSKKAVRQQDKVLEIFRVQRQATASEVWQHFDKAPLTSVRRAISDLTKLGYLEKTEDYKQGLYGRNETIYKIAIDEKG